MATPLVKTTRGQPRTPGLHRKPLTRASALNQYLFKTMATHSQDCWLLVEYKTNVLSPPFFVISLHREIGALPLLSVLTKLPIH